MRVAHCQDKVKCTRKNIYGERVLLNIVSNFGGLRQVKGKNKNEKLCHLIVLGNKKSSSKTFNALMALCLDITASDIYDRKLILQPLYRGSLGGRQVKNAL